MNPHITSHIESLILDHPQHFENMTVLPVRHDGPAGPHYLTLDEALAEGSLEIREVDKDGSVPTLTVVNAGKRPVLILDGEELCGAKQNRILNVSVLVPAGIEMAVPVSCTEQGRWHEESRHFSASGNLMFGEARSLKMCSVSDSLASTGSHRGDQGEVWRAIDCLADEAGVVSPTEAMSDIYTQHGASLREYLQAFPRQTDQCGLLVLIDGRCIGLDVVSRPAAYAGLHDKLLRSFAMDASIRAHGGTACERHKIGDSSPEDTEAAQKTARDFLQRVARCTEESFASPGRGRDLRFHGPGVVGSALLLDDAVLHTVFLARERRSKRSAGGRIHRHFYRTE